MDSILNAAPSSSLQVFTFLFAIIWGWNTAVGIATRYSLESPGIEFVCVKVSSAFQTGLETPLSLG